MKHRIVVLIFLSGVMPLSAEVKPPAPKQERYHNSISKIFFHEGVLGDKFVCYFAKEPVCNTWPLAKQPEKGNQTVEYFMPNTTVERQAVDASRRVQHLAHDGYTLALEPVNKPMPGIKMRLTFDPAKVGYRLERFEAVGKDKGIVLHVYHKDVLKQIQGKTDTLLRTACASGKPRVMIDCGHGGADAGTRGIGALAEKDLTLMLGKKLCQQLQRQGCQVLLTRWDDRTLALEERTKKANTAKADIFVSIHANSAANEKAQGIETFWTGRHLFKQDVVCLDPQSLASLISHDRARDEASNQLATFVHQQSIASIKQHTAGCIDRLVKKSVCQVLLGTDMPAALIEVGFLTNPAEAQLLHNNDYQQRLVTGICSGVTSYLKSVRRL